MARLAENVSDTTAWLNSHIVLSLLRRRAVRRNENNSYAIHTPVSVAREYSCLMFIGNRANKQPNASVKVYSHMRWEKKHSESVRSGRVDLLVRMRNSPLFQTGEFRLVVASYRKTKINLCMAFRKTILSKAQLPWLVTGVWFSIEKICVRKHQVKTGCLCYVPSTRRFFFLAHPNRRTRCATWMTREKKTRKKRLLFLRGGQKSVFFFFQSRGRNTPVL